MKFCARCDLYWPPITSRVDDMEAGFIKMGIGRDGSDFAGADCGGRFGESDIGHPGARFSSKVRIWTHL